MASSSTLETTPGDLRHRIVVEKRPSNPAGDGAGNYEGDGWIALFERSAQIMPLMGGEEVTAQRLQGVDAARIRIRSDTTTRQLYDSFEHLRLRDITGVNAKRSVVYKIKSVQNIDMRNIWLTLTCTSGEPIP